ncbi:MAG TPA: (d)CMP kinase [Micavibrio sp.]|nr:(d)CMP kinase [Micavibrio sp.]HIL28008.1 (d)CMP kinase [Micavibrio sp.]
MSTEKVIAVDGTAASGKGTLAKRLAKELGFAYLDTGKLYRYVGARLLARGVDPQDEAEAIAVAQGLNTTLKPEDLQDPALGSDENGQAASKVAALTGVRTALLDYQQNFAKTPPGGASGAILDGRDIGTVICPDADLKLYIDANLEIRAQRRFKELQSKGISVTYDAVLADMLERDKRDSSRATAPMKPADDAIVLDTSTMSADDVFDKVRSAVTDRLGI